MRPAEFGWRAIKALPAFALLLTPITATAKTPTVVVSLPPLHSIAASVMGKIGTPHLMLRGGQSPHNVALRPSDLRRLEEATLILWVGPTLETYLAKPLATIARRTKILTLLDQQTIKLLPRRKGSSWDSHGHGHDHEAPRGLSNKVIDPHLWLSPLNAIAIARSVADALVTQDPANAAVYKSNTEHLIKRIRRLGNRLRTKLMPVRQTPYLVFHDAYQYFERHFALKALGAVSINPERRPGARRISKIRQRIKVSGVRCVFREPQFPPRLINTITKDTSARIGLLDPLGAAILPGPDQWFKLMTGLGNNLTRCLEGGS
jgi:zinc transport system substrate-binding protein